MATPTMITLTGDFETPPGVEDSTVQVTLEQLVYLTHADGTIIEPTKYVGTADASGHVSMQVPATNDPAWSPVGWTYRVVFDPIDNQPQRPPFRAGIAYDAPGGVVSLGSLVPILASGGNIYAPINHTHPSGDVTLEDLEDGLATKADVVHTHSDLASDAELATALAGKSDTGHSHPELATDGELSTLAGVVAGKADSGHTHSDLATDGELSALATTVAGKADTGHTHSDLTTDAEFTTLSGTVALKADKTALAQIPQLGNSVYAIGGAETMFRAGLNEFPGATGRLWINYFTPPVDSLPITKLTITSGGTAAVSCTLARMCIFTVASDGSVTLVARTANQTGIGAGSFTPYQFPLATAGGFPSSYSLVAGQRYAFGFLQVAATAMSPTGLYLADFSADPVMCRSIDGQADIAASYAVGTLTVQFTECYMAGRP